MISRIMSALEARRAAMLEAEALVYRFGSRGVEMAQDLLPRSFGLPTTARTFPAGRAHRQAPPPRHQVSRYCHAVLRDGPWQHRPGNLIGGGHRLYELLLFQASQAVSPRPERSEHRNGALRRGSGGLRGLRQPSRRTRTSATSGADGFTGVVTRVVDGDTFWLSSLDVRIRVWGLDAPETDQPGGSQATAICPA